MFKESKIEKLDTESDKIIIPDEELTFTFSRSGGPGGQNVNKVETKATVRWSFGQSSSVTDEQKAVIAEKLSSRTNESGELVVSSQSTRSQLQNRSQASTKLRDLVNNALTPEKERIPTQTPEQAKNKRIGEKKKRSQLKQSRGRVDYE